MKFTKENVLTEYQKLSEKERKQTDPTFRFVKRNFDLIDKSPQIKKVLDTFLAKLNAHFGDKTPAPSPKSQKSPKEKKAKAPKQPKSKETKPGYTGAYVEKISPEVAFIRRYTHFHEQKLNSETKDKARKLLTSLQKAIVEKQIRKTSEYAAEINAMQSSLIILVNARADGSVITIASIEKLREIAKSQKVSDRAANIKAFLAIQGKEGVKEKAKALIEKIYASQKPNEKDGLIDIRVALADYINGKTPTPEVSTRTLQGLYGLAGVETPTPKSGTGISANQFIASSFDTLDFTGKWLSFIGRPAKNFKIMVYGKAGSGKSTFSLKFADYLAQTGKQVLFVAGEEKFGYTLHEKIVRLGISSPNLILIDKLPADVSAYDVIFLDSVNTLALSPDELEHLPKSKAYVWIFQCTKDGSYRGEQAYEHNADTVIEIAEMKATMHKNRFGGKSTEMAF